MSLVNYGGIMKQNFKRGYTIKGILVLAALSILMLAVNASALSDTGTSWSNGDNTFLGLVNNYRAANGLDGVSVDVLLQNAATWMSDDLLTHCVTGNYPCSHTDSLGRSTDQRMRAFGYPAGDPASWGEIIAWGNGGWGTSAQDAFNAWKSSPGHNAIMLGSDFKAIGISNRCNDAGCVWIADFGSQLVQPFNPSPSPPPPPPPNTISTVSIYGTVYNDADGNGILESDEHGLPGRTVTLAGFVNNRYVNRQATTDSNGNYVFADLSPGTQLSISTGFAVGWRSTTQRYVSVKVSSSDENVNFGSMKYG